MSANEPTVDARTAVAYTVKWREGADRELVNNLARYSISGRDEPESLERMRAVIVEVHNDRGLDAHSRALYAQTLQVEHDMPYVGYVTFVFWVGHSVPANAELYALGPIADGCQPRARLHYDEHTSAPV